MMSESEENRLDESLRSKFEDFDLPPGAPVWAGIEQRLPPPPRLRPRRRPVLLPLLFVLTGLLAGLGGWLLPHGTGRVPVETPSRLVASQQLKMAKSSSDLAKVNPKMAKSSSVLGKLRSGIPKMNSTLAKTNSNLAKTNPRTANSSSGMTKVGFGLPNLSSEEPNGTRKALNVAREGVTAVAPSAPAAAETLPATLRSLAALERQTLEQLPSIGTLAPGALPADGRAALLNTLRTERAELFRLQRRTDSLLLALGDLPGAAPRLARADTTQPATRNQKPETPKWSLMLTATPEQNTLTLQGPEGDSLTALRRNRETGRAGLSAALTAEYRLTPRLSVGGGVGYTAFGADLRITNKTTDVRVAYNTTTSTSTNVFTSTYQTNSIRIVQVPQLSPIFNGSGQVIRYDTVYVPRQDTVFTTIVQHDTTHTTTHTTTPTITKKETLTSKLLQPNYRFFTVPVLLRYRLAAPGSSRLWTDVAVGAQFQFFLGGTQVVTPDGENFRTERITAGTGPFRALNVALSGSLALNYALTNRLSVSVAPNMRWQALSLYKPETGLRQQATSTGLMFGVRFGL